MPKMGNFGQNPRFWAFFRKIAIFSGFPGSPALPRGGFYINPSRRTPRSLPGAQKGLFPGIPRGGPKKAIFGTFRGKSPKSGILGLPGPQGPPGPPRFPGDPSRGPGGTPPQEEGPGVVPQPLICRGGGGHRRGCPRLSRRLVRSVWYSGIREWVRFVLLNWLSIPEVVFKPNFYRTSSRQQRPGQPGPRYAP